MQQWEYAVVRVLDHSTVYTMNGQEIGKIKATLFSGTQSTGPNLWDFLNQLGQEGWEVVGVTPTTGTGETYTTIVFIVILKRPKA